MKIPMLLILALINIESGGDNDAVGDSGRSYGALQIHECVIKDVNRIYGTEYIHLDAFDRAKAIDICRLYLEYWCSSGRLGREATLEDYARAWNGGGPRGYKKPSTLKYWIRVKQQLNK